jgi:tol-pal system protein YbgF
VVAPQEYGTLQEDVRVLRRDVAALSRIIEGGRAFAEERLARVETQIRERLQAVEGEERAKLDQVLTSLREEAQRLSQAQGELSGKIGEATSESRIVQGRLEETAHRFSELNRRIDALEVAVRLASQKPPAAPSPPGATSPQAAVPGAGATPAPSPAPAPLPPPAAATAPAVPPGATPDEVYKAALNDYTRGNYELAISGFKTYIQLFPKTSRVGNAQYWLGESYYSQRNYAEAIREFDAVVKNHADSNKVPSAMLKQGYAYLELGETARGTATLRELVNRFKNSREARLAQERLRQIQ